MTVGSWRMVDTSARRMGISFDEASSIADDCVRREWVDHRQHPVQRLEKGRIRQSFYRCWMVLRVHSLIEAVILHPVSLQGSSSAIAPSLPHIEPLKVFVR
jgi:hypothetical protein